MALNLGLPGISCRSHPPQQHLFKTFDKSNVSSSRSAVLLFLLSRCCSFEISPFKNIAFSSSLYFRNFHAGASLKGAGRAGDGNPVSELLDGDLLRRVATVKNADEALQTIEEGIGRNEGVVGMSDCCLIIQAAFDGGNTELALSVFEAMRLSFDEGVGEQESSIERWRWARPDAHTCAVLVCGLAGALQVSEAIRMIAKLSRMGASPGEECIEFRIYAGVARFWSDIGPYRNTSLERLSCVIVSNVLCSKLSGSSPHHPASKTQCYAAFMIFVRLSTNLHTVDVGPANPLSDVMSLDEGNPLSLVLTGVVPFGKIVRCPSCMIAIAVAQPQHGIQISSCSKCRYQYELVSGDIISIESEEISMDISAWEKGLRFLQVMKQSIPAAVHSIVVRTPSGTARTHRFATKTVELPAQEGERVTIASAAPSSVYREMGLLRVSPKAPGYSPGEPMCLTNHTSGQESLLLRAPMRNGSSSLLNPSVLLPIFALLASGDAATGIIDPSLPKFISIAAVASLALGTTVNLLVLPQLNQLPQKMVDVVAIKQQLLSQYDMLQNRLKDLSQAVEKEVWMLARMCQLENKIVAVGEPSYRARRSRVRRVRESLENSLMSRIELIDSYAKISSMIEIEVEMDSDVLAAEAVSNMESIAEQIEQMMELENLEQKWRTQAEANDEAERLLSSQPVSTEPV